jgi:hypothetical protein
MLQQADVDSALASQTITGGSTTITLVSGAKVVLVGYTTTLTSSDFGHVP